MRFACRVLRINAICALISWMLPSMAAASPQDWNWDPCLKEEAREINLNPAILHAIVKIESNGHPYAFGWKDHTGRHRSFYAPSIQDAIDHLSRLRRANVNFDVGLAQINRRNLERFEQTHGIKPVHALNPCVNLRLARLILEENLNRYGHTWKAIAAYNGSTEYIKKIWKEYCRATPRSTCRERP